jgi:hypothetical protein
MRSTLIRFGSTSVHNIDALIGSARQELEVEPQVMSSWGLFVGQVTLDGAAKEDGETLANVEIRVAGQNPLDPACITAMKRVPPESCCRK